MASTTDQAVEVRLQVINEDESGESHATRYLTLEAPSYSIRIGRGSRSGSKDLYPSDDNAWFDSRVMSREHAILKAHPDSKTLTIEDAGSMHGTYVDEVRLLKYQSKVLYNGDQIVFGAEVSRGHDTFPALEINIHYSFDGDEDIREAMTANESLHTSGSRNSFSVPDYDSEDDYSDMDVKVIPPARNEAIPDSDISNGGSFASDDDDGPQDSWNRIYCNTFQAAQKASQELNKQTKTSPADVIMWSSCPDGNEEGHTNTPNASNKASAIRALAKDNPPASQQLDMQSSITVQSTAEPVAIEINDSGNLTDEQSESDYGDDISADLFDEDFDEDYQGARQPDTSSFSSQSPILTSLPSKIEFAAHQSTVNEAVKQILPSSSLSVTSAPRPPSPSDAAMPKVKAINSVIFPHAPQRQHQKPGGPLTTVPSSNYPAYTPVPSQDPSYMRSYGYTSSQDIHGVQDTYPQPYYPLDVYSPYYEAPALDWGWGASQIPIKPAAAAPKTLEPVPAPVPAPASPFVTIKTAPRVAIKDLVDEPETIEGVSQGHHGKPHIKANSPLQQRAEIVPTFSGTKRKADQISEDALSAPALFLLAETEAAGESSPSQDQQEAQTVKTLTSTTNSQSQTDLLKPVGLLDDVLPTPLVPAGERPKKKARSNFYKKAVGAAGWMAVGAVGAVAALVALPADFFV